MTPGYPKPTLVLRPRSEFEALARPLDMPEIVHHPDLDRARDEAALAAAQAKRDRKAKRI